MITEPRDQIPGWEGTTGPFPAQYGKPHVYARDVHSGAGNCVCGAGLPDTRHAAAAPGVPIPTGMRDVYIPSPPIYDPAPVPKGTYVPELAALDRCEHGRHVADNCGSCPGRWSTGNLFLTPGQRIGTTLYGDPIIVPEHDQRGRSENWVEGEGRRIK